MIKISEQISDNKKLKLRLLKIKKINLYALSKILCSLERSGCLETAIATNGK